MSKSVNRSTNRDESNVNDHWGLGAYGPSRNDGSGNSRDHNTIVLENEFGRYKKCLNCGVEAVGNMMNQFDCEEQQ